MKAIIKVILICFLLTNISGCASKSTITQISLDPTTKLDDVYLEALGEFNTFGNYVAMYEFSKNIKQFSVNLSASNYNHETIYEENKFEFTNDSSKSFTMLNAYDDTSQRVAIIQDDKIIFEATLDLTDSLDILDEKIKIISAGMRSNLNSNNNRIPNIRANEETLMYYSIHTPLGTEDGSFAQFAYQMDPWIEANESDYVISCIVEFAY